MHPQITAANLTQLHADARVFVRLFPGENAINQRADGDLCIELITAPPGIHDPELVQIQVRDRGLHRTGDGWRVGPLKPDLRS